MRRIYRTFTILIVTIGLMSASSQDKFLSFAKSIETYAAILNELDKNYISNVDIDQISDRAMFALTKDLDEYTYVLSSSDSSYKNKFDTEFFYGIGVELIEKNGKKIIARVYRQTAAHRAGLQCGDELLKINNLDLISKTENEVLNMLKGSSNSLITLQIQRFGSKEPKVILINREKIKSYNIVYFSNMATDIAYLKIEDFGSGVANEVKSILTSLKSLGISRIILDLRGNVGGIVDEAVQVLEQFLDFDTLVVKSVGKTIDFNKEYRTAGDTFDVVSPIVILVDDQTASAAEIVAGVMQDLDRGIVIGKPTFGKGTIQAIKDLPYGNRIKVTTAKYILPSGRSISTFLNPVSGKSYKSKQFKTKLGRVLYEQQGITPDIIIPDSKFSQITNDILSLGYLENFAVLFRSKNKEISKPESFVLSDSSYQDFVNWMGSNNIFLPFEKKVGEFISSSYDSGYGDLVKKQLSTLQAQIIRARQGKLQQLKKEIKPLLERMIAEQYYMYEGGLEASFANDAYLQRAISILHNAEEYAKIFIVKQ